MKVENGTKNQLFKKVRRWDLLKTVSRSGFEKTWKIYEKTIGKIMVLDGPKPLKSIEKQTLFLTLGHSKKKRYQRGPQKSCFLVQNGDMGVPGSTYRLIFDVLLRCQKIIILAPSRWTNKSKKSSLGAPRAERHTKGSETRDPGRPPGTPPPHSRSLSPFTPR